MEKREQLLALWKQAFGEHDGFWELFMRTGFSPQRCRYLEEKGRITAALTWLDVTCRGQKMAYIYAVVTHPAHRGRGLCRKLLEQTHAALKEAGYAAALLVPAEPELREMYQKLGYDTCTRACEFSCAAAEQAIPLALVDEAEYAALRRRLLPEGGVLQEGENLAFLSAQAQLYAGDGVLLAAYAAEGKLFAMELLGPREAAPGILKALGFESGSFRCPGGEVPFAMWHPLSENAQAPDYFGFAFD